MKAAENGTESEEESDHEESCHVCGGDGLMILCDSCPLSYHFECHNPPLRRAPKYRVVFVFISLKSLCFICDAFRDLVSFVQFKKREKHLWKSITFSKINTPL